VIDLTETWLKPDTFIVLILRDRGQYFHARMKSVSKVNCPEARICILLVDLDRKHSEVSKTV
jgi:hypothetical protein